MNAAVLFIALLLFGWLWGGWGLLPGAPLIVIAKSGLRPRRIAQAGWQAAGALTTRIVKCIRMRLSAYANAQTVVDFLHIILNVVTVFGSIRFRQDQIKVNQIKVTGA